jgi:hypothetical protein
MICFGPVCNSSPARPVALSDGRQVGQVQRVEMKLGAGAPSFRFLKRWGCWVFVRNIGCPRVAPTVLELFFGLDTQASRPGLTSGAPTALSKAHGLRDTMLESPLPESG